MSPGVLGNALLLFICVTLFSFSMKATVDWMLQLSGLCVFLYICSVVGTKTQKKSGWFLSPARFLLFVSNLCELAQEQL